MVLGIFEVGRSTGKLKLFGEVLVISSPRDLEQDI